ncbi:hypothetical protein ACOSQ2_016654 [Xanthoceras sorbifolium]
MKESDEEKLVKSIMNKDKDPAFKEPRVVLDFRSAVSPPPSLSMEEVFGKVLRGEIHSAYQENANGFLGDTVERQL